MNEAEYWLRMRRTHVDSFQVQILIFVDSL